MKIGIIGAGVTGLTVAYRLSQKGQDVVVFEKDKLAGGLAFGFASKSWDWSVEKYYHHWFASDRYALKIARELGIKVISRYPKSSYLIDGKIIRFDSPLSLLSFPYLSLVDKLRQAFMLVFLKIFPFWNILEKIPAQSFIESIGGRKAWDLLWAPLFEKKFGIYADEIPTSWFWARIRKRSAKLIYPLGGFARLTKTLVKEIERNGGKVFLNTGIVEISRKSEIFSIKTQKGDVHHFDKLIVASGFNQLIELYRDLPKKYVEKIAKLKWLGAINIVLELNENVLANNTYWLNITEKDSKFLAVVEHTHFINNKHYNGNTILYLGSYLPSDSSSFKKGDNLLISEAYKFLKKVNPQFRSSWVVKSWVFRANYAQPVVCNGYSKMVPEFATPVKNLFVMDMSQIYPWDRGTNYAIEAGERLARLVLKN